jgi:hypothetical protein
LGQSRSVNCCSMAVGRPAVSLPRPRVGPPTSGGWYLPRFSGEFVERRDDLQGRYRRWSCTGGPALLYEGL